MISVAEAKKLVEKNVSPLAPITVPLTDAAGLVLAEDIHSAFNIPAFRQSSMDGYAFRFDDWIRNKTLEIEVEIPAGRTDIVQIGKNKAARIFTGAPIPVEADTVVMQEKTLVNNSVLEINDPELQKGSNIRNIGSEIANGVLGLTRGTRLTPGAIGFLATIGKDKIPVFPTPRVSIIVTGKEIRQPGERLQHGQVYECNSFTLRAALRELQITDIGVEHANDEPEELKSIIAHHLNASDVLLITGGVSVGDYDFVTQALKDCEVEKVFHRVKQRPGKPLFFGKIGNKIVFGLPGNPSSVLSCYYQYVVPGIERIMQFPESTVLTTYLPLTRAYIKKRGLTYFLRGIYNSKGVTPLGGQESYKLQSFANANCLICLPEDEEKFEKDELVEVHILHT